MVVPGVAEPATLSPHTRGLQTHARICELFDRPALDAQGSPDAHCRTYHYDDKGRVLQSVETTPLGHRFRVSYKYDYRGNILLRDEQYIASSTDSVDVRYSYTYDSRGRRMGETVAVNGTPCSTSEQSYDALGRLVKTQIPTAGLTGSYSYNLQGWLTQKSYSFEEIFWDSINNRPVSMFTALLDLGFSYSDPEIAAPQYSGNISEHTWMRELNPRRSFSYAYRYDSLNRLTDADLYNGGLRPSKSDVYSERNIRYDKNGNMLSIDRYNGPTVSRYDYSHTGNQLSTGMHYPGTRLPQMGGGETVVFSTEGERQTYSYDTMGNLTQDGDQNLTLEYNLINLPQRISSSVGLLAKYRYLWNGAKVSSTDAAGNGYVYLGSARYVLQNGSLSFESIPISDGRITREGETFTPRYFLTDHLGNVRTVVNAQKEILAEYDYLPYGTQHADATQPQTNNDHRYNGKEIQERFGFDYYDYLARFMGLNGRFLSPDPLAWKFPWASTYLYCGGNPIRFLDPDGRKIVDAHGRILYDNGNWTKAAKSTDAMRLGNAVMRTKSGRNTWNAMVKSEKSVSLSLSAKLGKSESGNLALGVAKHQYNENKKSVHITVYEGSVNEFIRPDKTYEDTEKQELMREVSPEARLGAVVAHEGLHVIDEVFDGKPNREDRASENQKE